jgi:hypothetical protein
MHHLVPKARRYVCLVGSFLETHEEIDLRAEQAAIEVERFLAAAVEEQIGLNVHGNTS